MSWKIADAKQHLSEVIRRAGREPQLILNRARPVAGVVAAEELSDYIAWRKSRSRVTLADALAQARAICAEESYTLTIHGRRDRPNPVVRGARHAHRRHERRQ